MIELENVRKEIMILDRVKEWMRVMNFSTIEELEEWFLKTESYLLPENIKKRQEKQRKKLPEKNKKVVFR